jgi:DNA-binding NarL/FixJ family response regulator
MTRPTYGRGWQAENGTSTKTADRAKKDPDIEDEQARAGMNGHNPMSTARSLAHRRPTPTLPRTSFQAALPTPAPVTGETDGPPAIGVLIVDDRRMFAESLSPFLSNHAGIEVVGVARSKDEAVAIFEETRPTLVIVRDELGRTHGLETVSAIKAIDSTAIIVLTTRASADRVLIAAVAAGCSGLLTEDQSAEEVVLAIRAIAAGTSLISLGQLARIATGLFGTDDVVHGNDLTPRDKEILRLLATGMSGRAIAVRLHLSANTIRNYVQGILKKLGAHSRMEAVSIAVRLGVIDHPQPPD